MKMTRTCLILIICFSSLVRADPFDDRAISMETKLGLSLSCISTNVVLLQDQDVFCGRQWVEAGKTNRIAAVIGRVRSAPHFELINAAEQTLRFFSGNSPE